MVQTSPIILVLLGGLVTLSIWLLKSYQTRRLTKRALFLDIDTYREKLFLMGDFFNNLRDAIVKGKAKRIYYDPTNFSFYIQMIPKLHSLNMHELNVVKKFYDYYFTFEHDIVGLLDTLRQWEDRLAKGEKIDETRRQAALYNMERIIKLRELLIDATKGKTLKDFEADYANKLETWIKEYRK